MELIGSALVYNYILNAICGYSEQENGRNLSHSVINKGFKETTLLKDNPSISNVHDFIKNGIFSKKEILELLKL